MIRCETFCDGRLVQEIDQVDVSTTSLRDQWADGSWTWRLDGEEVRERDAEEFLATWETQATS